jgi:Flp pilus assembly protein TadG
VRFLPFFLGRERGRERARRPGSERGSTVVEFACVFPLFFTVVACALEGGRFVVSRMMLAYAVSVGARAATLSGASTTGVQTAVVNAAPMLHLSSSQVEVTSATGIPATVGTTITVSVGVVNAANAYTFQSVIPSRFSPFSTRNWTAQASMIAR